MQPYTYIVKGGDPFRNTLSVEYTSLSNTTNKVVVNVPVPANNTANLEFHINTYSPFVERPALSGNLENDFENGL